MKYIMIIPGTDPQQVALALLVEKKLNELGYTTQCFEEVTAALSRLKDESHELLLLFGESAFNDPVKNFVRTVKRAALDVKNIVRLSVNSVQDREAMELDIAFLRYPLMTQSPDAISSAIVHELDAWIGSAQDDTDEEDVECED